MTRDQLAYIAKTRLWAFPKLVSGHKCPAHLKFVANTFMDAIKNKSRKKQLLIFKGPPRHGKQIADSTPILTTDGWKAHGDLVIGDHVFNEQGHPVKILNISEKTKATIELKFSNGEKIKCHENHEWIVAKKRKGYKRVETKEIIKQVKIIEGGKERNQYALPLVSALHFESKDLELDPYFMGLWLGDGRAISPTIGNSDSECFDNLEYIYSSSWPGVGLHYYYFSGLTDKFKSLNLFNNKHIPEIYKRASIEQRLELLAGMIDSDGHKDGSDRYRISCSEKILVDDIYELCAGLGLSPYIMETMWTKSTKGQKKQNYQIGFNSEISIPCRVPRKQLTKKFKRRRISITGWSYCDPESGHCIHVEGGIYLVGKTLIPTHNSELLPIHAPPWILGNYPKSRIIIAAYAASLAEKHSARGRDIFGEWSGTLWGVNPHPKVFSRSTWDNDRGGGVRAVGIGGSATGYGADFMFIDDYHSDRKESESALQRDTVWDWWQSVAITRLHPGGIVCIFATAWHDDDLVGRLIKQAEADGEKFPFKLQVINLPAIAEENDALGRKPGEALWPWWSDVEELEDIKNAVGSYEWSALYQGSPTLRGGTLFKSEFFRYYAFDPMTKEFVCYRADGVEPIRIKKTELMRHVYCDPAIEIKKTSDPTGMAAWGYSRRYRVWLLLDRVNERIEHTQVMARLKLFAFKNDCVKIGIENEKLGKVLVKQSAGNDKINGVSIPFVEIKTGGLDKYARATPMAGYVENERVFFPRDAAWLSDYESSLVKFPNAEHDEDVDITSMAEWMESSKTLAEVLAGK